MGFIKSIYFADDLQEQISKEDNLSNLISSLLRDYYKEHLQQKKKSYLTMEDIRKEKERLSQEEDDYTKAIEMLTVQEQDILKRAEESKKDADFKQKRALETFAGYIQHLFIVTPEDSVKLAEEYYFVRDKIDLYSWCESKNLTKREV